MGITNKEYAGTIVMEVNGVEYEISSVDPLIKTGNKVVPSMNSQKRALGTTAGTKEISLKVEAFIPLDGSEPDWINMKNATITIYPVAPGGKREIFVACTTEEVGSKYSVGKEAVRSISMHALDHQVV